MQSSGQQFYLPHTIVNVTHLDNSALVCCHRNGLIIKPGGSGLQQWSRKRELALEKMGCLSLEQCVGTPWPARGSLPISALSLLPNPTPPWPGCKHLSGLRPLLPGGECKISFLPQTGSASVPLGAALTRHNDWG